MRRADDGVWAASSSLLTPGRRYTIRVHGPEGPRHAFSRDTHLLDPYARGLVRVEEGAWRGVVVDDGFDWGGVGRPGTPLADSVIYEAHVRGLTKQLRGVPPHLRGTYAGLAHPATVAHLTELGVTAVELLPVQAFASERRLVKQGLANYWGYNTVGFFAPHMQYATLAAQRGGPQAVLTEFKGMVRLLHEAGIEVILDVVYNHTAEEGLDGPTLSFRGIDNSTYYRQDDSGRYLDTTGCGNTLDFSRAAVQRLVLDSVKYWAEEVQVDGFRFDLAVTLGRDGGGAYSPESPLLTALRDDPALAGVKLIAEPWDVGLGGWQTGGFPDGWSEWNDRYRDTRARLLADRPARAPQRRLSAHLGRRDGRRPGRLELPLQRGAGPARLDRLRDRARRLHPRRPHGVQHEAQPRQRRVEPRRHRQQPLVQLRRGGADAERADPRLAAQGDAEPARARCCSRRACRCSWPATSSAAPSAATTTPTATTPGSPG